MLLLHLALKRVESGLAWLVRGATILLMATILIFTIGSASDRYIYDTSFNAHDQIAQLALVWLTFLGFMLALRARTNIRVDLIDGVLSPHGLRVRNIAGDLVAIGLFCVIQWKVWRLVEVGAGQVIMGTPFSSALTFLAIAVGTAYGILVIALRLTHTVVHWRDSEC